MILKVGEKLTNTGSGLSMAPCNFDFKKSDSVCRKFRYRSLKIRIYGSVVASSVRIQEFPVSTTICIFERKFIATEARAGQLGILLFGIYECILGTTTILQTRALFLFF
jgi:hypothetical protein